MQDKYFYGTLKIYAYQMIEKDIEYRAKKLAEEKEIDFISVDDMFGKFPIEMQAKTDHIIEKIFALQKNWLQYRAPKWINVVDSLQKYATQKLGLLSGDYSYIAEMIENETHTNTEGIFFYYSQCPYLWLYASGSKIYIR